MVAVRNMFVDIPDTLRRALHAELPFVKKAYQKPCAGAQYLWWASSDA